MLCRILSGIVDCVLMMAIVAAAALGTLIIGM